MICPKCKHERSASDSALEGVCPKCGVVYAKFIRAQQSRQFELEAKQRLSIDAAPSTEKRLSKPTETTSKADKYIRGLIAAMVVFALAYFIGGKVSRSVPDGVELRNGVAVYSPEDTMKGIYDKVASDALAQYQMVERTGSDIDKCVQAGMVAAAYLQAQDEDSYKYWKEREETRCSIAAGAH